MDRWLGTPICFILTLLRAGLGRRLLVSAGIRSLLFIKLAEQGSTVLAYPAIRQAIELFGHANVYFVVFEDNRFILDVMDLIPRENVFTISFESFAAMLRTTFRALYQIRKIKIDAAIDLEFFTRGSAILTFLTGAKRRIGFHSFFQAGPYRGNLMTHRLLYNPHLHTSQTFRVMVEAAKMDGADLPALDLKTPVADELPAQFQPAIEETEIVRGMLRSELGQCPPLILLNPNASDLLPLRRWPSHRYIELAKRLLARYSDVAVVFTGAPNESQAIAK